MTTISEHDIFIFVAQLGVILFLARFFGEIAKRLGQPVLVGEVLAGIFLGPAVLGRFFPVFHEKLFPTVGLHDHLLQGLSWLCILFLLLITGLEVDVRSSLRQARQSIRTSSVGIVFSLLAIFLFTLRLPESFYPAGANPLHVNLMLTTSLSVVAIPVIAKILFDLKILRSDVGLNIVTSGILSDFWGWAVLSVVIAFVGNADTTILSAVFPLITIVLYIAFTVTTGRWIVERIFSVFEWIGLDVDETASMMAILFSLSLLNCAFAHLLGVHVIFGAFIAGLMAGESDRITTHMRQSIQDFILGVFAPIFFVLVGMQLSFSAEMSWPLLAGFFLVASFSKIIGAFAGGLWAGAGRKNALAIAFGLNTQGSMGIIVALIAVNMGIFDEAIFSTVVIVCIFTSLLVGPMLKWAINQMRRPLAKYFDPKHVFLDIEGGNKHEIIHRMVDLMASRGLIDDPKTIESEIWARETTMSTAIGEGVALPHARIDNLKTPILGFFRLKRPVDFSSPDNVPVQLLFLELTDAHDDGTQLNLTSQVARFISAEENRRRLLDCKNEEEVHHILSFDERL